MKPKRLLQIIGAVAIINMLSRLIGFFREAVIGYQFGTSMEADSIALAYTLPNFFYIVVGGAITTAFISVYSKVNDPLEQKRYLERIFGWLTIVLVVFTTALVFFSDQVILLLFPGLGEAEFQLTTDLFRVMAPSVFFLILSMWLTGLLNVNDRFTWTATSTLVLNGSFLLIAVLFYPLLGAYAHAWGALVSAFFMAAFLVVLIRRHQLFHFRIRLEKSPEMWRTVKMAVPIMLGGATLQLYFLIHRVFASWLESGYVAALNYMSKLVQMPQSILMMAVTMVIYPLLARKVAAKEETGIRALYAKGIQMMGMMIVPVSVFIMFYAEEVIRVIFQYGNFSAQSTELATPLLQILVIGMFFHAANMYVTRFYYAYEHSVFPVAMSLLSVLGINVGINLLLIQPFGAAGLAWGTSLSAICNFLLLLIGLKSVLKWKKDETSQSSHFVLKLTVLVILFSGMLYSWKSVIVIPNAYISLIVGGAVSTVGLFLLMKLLHFEEVDAFVTKIKKKVGKRE